MTKTQTTAAPTADEREAWEQYVMVTGSQQSITDWVKARRERLGAGAAHEVTLMVGPRYVRIPRCTCGWKGRGTYDAGEATRSGYAHMRSAS